MPDINPGCRKYAKEASVNVGLAIEYAKGYSRKAQECAVEYDPNKCVNADFPACLMPNMLKGMVCWGQAEELYRTANKYLEEANRYYDKLRSCK